jgi:hypothetical protein
MMFGYLDERTWIIVPCGTLKVLRLLAKLLKLGSSGRETAGTATPFASLRSASPGQRRNSGYPVNCPVQVGSALLADRRPPARLPTM